MDTLQFAETKMAVSNEGYYNPREDFEKWDTDLLIEYLIKTQHVFSKDNAGIIYCIAQEMLYKHSEKHPELITLTESIFLFFHDLLNQIKKEEFFFAYIRQIAKEKQDLQTSLNADLKALKATIKVLQNDQKKSLNYLKAIRQITENYKIPSDACHYFKTLFEKLNEFEESLMLHFHLEKDILFLRLTLPEKKYNKKKCRSPKGFDGSSSIR